MAAHIRGNIEVGVKPGIVLISLTTSDAVGHHEEVDPGQALAADSASKARTASARSSLLDVGGQVGRDVELGVLLGEVLGVEVVELVVAADPDLGRDAASRAVPSSAASTPHSTSRAPSAATSTSTLGSWRCASSIAASSSEASCTLEMPMLEPPRAGFTNNG